MRPLQNIEMRAHVTLVHSMFSMICFKHDLIVLSYTILAYDLCYFIYYYNNFAYMNDERPLEDLRPT